MSRVSQDRDQAYRAGRPSPWPPPLAVIRTGRIELEPICPAHAEAMAEVLADPALYAYIGGSPPTADELRERYARLASGVSPDGAQGWLNWVIRVAPGRTLIGYLQATAVLEARTRCAELAWVVGSAYQGRGYADEAAAMVVATLREVGVTVFRANIESGHRASERVAQRLGLQRTDVLVDGETRWELVG